MDINQINNLAKVAFKNTEYQFFMSKINNKQLNIARIFIEDTIEKTKSSNISFVFLKKLDNVITNEIIKNIEINGSKTISK